MKLLRAGVFVLVAFAVLAHGGVEQWAQAVLALGAAALLLAWAVVLERNPHWELRWHPLLWPLIGLLLLGAFQWLAGLSSYGFLTRLELLRLGTYLALGFLAVQAFRTPGEWKRLVWSLLVLAFGVSVFAIVQEFTWNGKLYWVRPIHESVRGFGPFVNRNHFAGFIELVLPLGLALLLFHGEKPSRRPLLWTLVVFPLGALLLSASRGGIVSLLFEIVLLGLAVGWFGGWPARRTLLGLAVAGVAVGTWLGVGSALRRFQQISHNQVTQNLRFQLVRETGRIFLAHRWTGTGLGTFITVYPAYAQQDIGLVVNHAHNDYMELLAEGGLVAGGLAVWFWWMVLRRGIRNLRRAVHATNRSLYVGAATGCAGLMLHELVDFNLHIPSNALLFFLITLLLTSVIPEPIINRMHRPRSIELSS